MRVAVRPRADNGRSRAHFAKSRGNPATGPVATEFTGGSVDDCPELDCIRASLAGGVIENAARRAAALGVSAERVLIAAGTLNEEAYLRALAGALGVAFEPLDGAARAQCPIGNERLIESAAAGMLPVAVDGELYLVVAPRGAAVRRILQLIKRNPARTRLFRFTSAERLNRFALRHADTALAARAANSLKRKWPIFSAASPRWRTNTPSVAAVMLLALGAFVMAPAGTMLVFEMILAAMLLAWLGLRLAGACMKSLVRNPSPGLRALYQLVTAPYVWEKTEHGLAKSSRQAANLTRSLLALECYLSALKKSGDGARQRRSRTAA